jgi:hypothetical protein
MLILTVVHIYLACNSWDDTTFQGTCHKRQVNAVLGNIVLGTISPTTCWDDYALAPDATYWPAQGQCGATSG